MKKKIKDTRPGFNTAGEWTPPTVSEWKAEMEARRYRAGKRRDNIVAVLSIVIIIGFIAVLFTIV